jgi:hypothetical protein
MAGIVILSEAKDLCNLLSPSKVQLADEMKNVND